MSEHQALGFYICAPQKQKQKIDQRIDFEL
jgi:hypothetical protein